MYAFLDGSKSSGWTYHSANKEAPPRKNGNLRYDLQRDEWQWLPNKPDLFTRDVDVAVNYRNQGIFIFGVGREFSTPYRVMAAYLDLK